MQGRAHRVRKPQKKAATAAKHRLEEVTQASVSKLELLLFLADSAYHVNTSLPGAPDSPEFDFFLPCLLRFFSSPCLARSQ